MNKINAKLCLKINSKQKCLMKSLFLYNSKMLEKNKKLVIYRGFEGIGVVCLGVLAPDVMGN